MHRSTFTLCDGMEMRPPRHSTQYSTFEKCGHLVSDFNMTIAGKLMQDENSTIANFINNLRTSTSRTFSTSDTKLINKMQQDLDFPRLAIICYAGRQWSIPKLCN